MFPDWFMKPEVIFRTVLWLLGPFFTLFVGKVIVRRIENWHASRSEFAAKASLSSLYKAIDNPLTLLASVAYIVCFLPLPIAVAALSFTMYLAPYLPFPPPSHSLDPKLVQNVLGTLSCFIIFL
jgi:hypothetical protein